MNPSINDLIAAIDSSIGAMNSAVTFINGAAARQQAAIDAALANGATAEQLAPVVAEMNLMIAKRDELAAAIASNSPAAPTSAPTSAPTDAPTSAPTTAP